MILYFDTGIFLDYFSARGHSGFGMRTAGRGGRTGQELSKAAADLFQRVSIGKIAASTSALTFYEAEESIYKQLKAGAAGQSHAAKLIIPLARAVVFQMHTVTQLHKIDVCDLNLATVGRQLATTELLLQGVRSADALHISSALSLGAHAIITGNSNLLALDNEIDNGRGFKLRCLDTDEALRLVP